MGILFSHLLLESMFDLIPKADLKRKCPYFYSNFFLNSFGQYLKKKVKNLISNFIFKKSLDRRRVFFYDFFSEKLSTPKYAKVWVVACQKPKSRPSPRSGDIETGQRDTGGQKYQNFLRECFVLATCNLLIF